MNMSQRNSSRADSTVLALLVLVGAAMFVTAVLSSARAEASTADRAGSSECARYASEGVAVNACEQSLDLARSASARYRNVANAIADGYVPVTDCEESSTGAMGYHWARPDRLIQPSLTPSAPAILLYEPAGLGFRLVGVEYEATASVGGLPVYGPSPPDPALVIPAPTMFGGKKFDGPMNGHNPAQPWHYDLHVWIWTPNPDGVFADYNPAVHC